MSSERQTMMVPLWEIRPSRWQPRAARFDEDALVELAQSIRDNGLINPISVFSYADADGYNVDELIAGERRTRASIAIALAGAVPGKDVEGYARRMANVGLIGISEAERQILVRENARIMANVEPSEDMTRLHVIAVIENLDRAELTPVEEAHAYKALADTYGWSQRDLAGRVHKSQGYVAQRLALLDLPAEAQEAVNTRVLTIAHAREIGTLPAYAQKQLTERVIKGVEGGDSTREVGDLVGTVRKVLDPQRWRPNPSARYSPEERNRLLMLSDAAGRADEVTVDVLLRNLQRDGYWFRQSPKSVAENETVTAQLLQSLNAPIKWELYAKKLGRTCESCIFSGVQPAVTSSNIRAHCPRWKGEEVVSCVGYIGPDDPVLIPMRDYYVTKNILKEQQQYSEGYYYVDDLPLYVSAYEQAVNVRQSEKQAEEPQRQAQAKVATEIAAWWDLQCEVLLMGSNWCGQYCRACAHYMPHLQEQGLPPCYFALNPIDRSGSGWLVVPHFVVWRGENNERIPRCEKFRFVKIPPFEIGQYQGVRLPEREIFKDCFVEMSRAAYQRSYVQKKIGIFPLDWIVDTDELWRFMDAWDDATFVHLFRVVTSEFHAIGEYDVRKDTHSVTVRNPVTGKQETFAVEQWKWGGEDNAA